MSRLRRAACRAGVGALLLGWIGFAGCEAGRRTSEAAGVRDSSGVAIVTLSAASLDSVPEWRLGSTPSLVIGEREGDDGDERSRFFLISGLRKLAADRILVATDASKQVLVFDASGEVVWMHGRVGSGPGEYRHLQLLASSDTTSFTLHDGSARRLTVVPLDSSAFSLVSLQASPAGPFNPVYRFPSGGLLVRTPGPGQGDQETGFARDTDRVALVDSSLRMAVDLGMHPSTDLVSRPAGETYGFLLPAPYARELLVDANDSTIVLSSTGAFDVQLYSAAGRLRRRIRFPALQRPVTRAMREEYRTRLMRTATDERTRRTWELRSSDDVFGEFLPAIDQLRLDRLGLLWVRRTTTAVDAHAEWLVFTQGGALVARVQAPAMLALHDILRSAVLGVWTDAWGREQVHEYALERQPR